MNRAVLIVDDQPLIYGVLRDIVRAVYPGRVVHSEKGLVGAIQWTRATRHVDLVLLELGLPSFTGIEALERFRDSVSTIPIAIVSAHLETHIVRSALNAGAVGYLPKRLTPKMIVAALRVIAAGGIFIPREALGKFSWEHKDESSLSRGSATAWTASLTERQSEVLRLVTKGLTNREIAQQLGITEATVKQHTHTMYQILRVGNRTEAAIAATYIKN